ncbi:fructosamine kinase family protein [Chitinolyticbacter albus]|uniref:fructosamine kinase family protein n=1 Tax=Chitinolyticbacter albus TaxID=2961951 RepID=UPI00210C36BB|nr:fructosamine kinase family protein [Chitinolyticbacter albus]
MWNAIAAAISASLQLPVTLATPRSVGGGSINRACRVESDAGPFFVKLNQARRLPMFEAEAQGLLQLAEGARVPRPICHGVAGEHAFLVLEWLDLQPRGDDAALGNMLAGLHRITRPRHGWDIDNTIGSTPQSNAWCDDWIAFWREQRLLPQLALAARNGHVLRDTTSLLERFPVLFTGYTPLPSCLHGDLWSGNVGFLTDGAPVLFDPACYFGDRETDLAMSELFGGFGPRFRAAYDAAWPLDPGYPRRRALYQLYHLLNHLNLFGDGYLAAAQGALDQVVAVT